MSARMVTIRSCFAACSLAVAWLGMWLAWPSFAAEEEPAKKVALLVGVNKGEMRIFADKPLQFAERDVQELAAVLEEQGFTVRVLTGPQATKANIDNALATVLSGRRAKDVVVIGFAGHGVQMPQQDDQGKPVRDDRGRVLSDAYFCPVDAVFGKGTTMISLIRLVERLEVEGGINLLLVDACRDNPDLYRGATRSLSGDELVGRLPTNSAILFSCSRGQQALEHAEAGGGHGVFFHHVIEGLRGKAADPDTGTIGWDDLVTYVRKRVNLTARSLDPDGARRADELFEGRLQTPHELKNLIATPVLARLRIVDRQPSRSTPDLSRPATDRSASIQPVRDPSGEERDDNGLKMKLCWCPPGAFRMGSPKDEPGRIDDEGGENGPVSVTITRGFWMGKFELTQTQWQSVMGSTIREQSLKNNQQSFLAGEGPDHPMAFVDHNEAREFCRRFTEAERQAGRLPAGWEYRLPTEAEWEYACRAGTTTRYSFGDDESRLVGYAWFDGNSEHSSHPVGQKDPNRWGLHDMHGNVWEWCSDWYVGELMGGTDPRGPYRVRALAAQGPPMPEGSLYPKGTSFQEDPRHTVPGQVPASGNSPGPGPGCNPEGDGENLADVPDPAASGEPGGTGGIATSPIPAAPTRVIRGGSWLNGSRSARSASRSWFTPVSRVGLAPATRGERATVIRIKFSPTAAPVLGRSNDLGFRVARAPVWERFLGIDEEPVVDAAGRRGMKVANVFPGTPAQESGLQVGDVIYSINGYRTEQRGNLSWIIINAARDNQLKMNVKTAKDGEEHSITAELE
jgi:formylglycine-generating enzyme required for sulfatase activity